MSVFEPYTAVPEKVQAVRWDGREMTWTRLTAAVPVGTFIRRATTVPGGFKIYVLTTGAPDGDPDPSWVEIRVGEWIVFRHDRYQVMSDEKFGRRFGQPKAQVSRWDVTQRR